jgi:hypothetical protein
MSNANLIEYYARYNDAAVLALHKGVSQAYSSDRSLSNAQKVAAQTFGSELSYFGVDEFPDWKSHGTAIEAVLVTRRVKFSPILF